MSDPLASPTATSLRSFLRFSAWLLVVGGSSLVLPSCQDPIELDLPDGTVRPIVNARITNEDSVSAEVFWSSTYLNQSPNTPVSDAVLVLYANGLAVDTLDALPTKPGSYQGKTVGQMGNSYSLRVWMPGDPNPWITGAETIRRCPSIDSIYSENRPRAPFVRPGRYSLVHFTEPAGKGDQYRFKVWRNDTLENLPFNITFFDDQFNDGRSFNNVDFPAVEFAGPDSAGVRYQVEVSSISPEFFQFLNLLRQTTLQVGSPFDPAPALVVGNIWREADPREYALGYFYASGVGRASVVVAP